MDDLALSGTVIPGGVGEACTLDAALGSALESGAGAGVRGRTGGRPVPSGLEGPAVRELLSSAVRGAEPPSSGPSGLARAEPFYKVVPSRAGLQLRPGAIACAGQGYAPAVSAGAAAAARFGSTLATTSDEYAFLGDASLSIEDKLFTFMALKLKKGDEELVKKMNEYKAKQSGGGLLGDIVGALGDALGGIGDLVTDAAKTLGGPMLASLCVSFGMPFLVPAAMKMGGQLAGALVGTATGAVGGSDSSGSSEEDERLQMLELQRMVDKQNTMFSALSNVLKSTHDAQMTAVGNIR